MGSPSLQEQATWYNPVELSICVSRTAIFVQNVSSLIPGKRINNTDFPHSFGITTGSRVLLEELIVPQLGKKFPPFMESIDVLRSSREPFTETYPEPGESSPHS
jgi:hypothetical protein